MMLKTSRFKIRVVPPIWRPSFHCQPPPKRPIRDLLFLHSKRIRLLNGAFISKLKRYSGETPHTLPVLAMFKRASSVNILIAMHLSRILPAKYFRAHVVAMEHRASLGQSFRLHLVRICCAPAHRGADNKNYRGRYYPNYRIKLTVIAHTSSSSLTLKR